MSFLDLRIYLLIRCGFLYPFPTPVLHHFLSHVWIWEIPLLPDLFRITSACLLSVCKNTLYGLWAPKDTWCSTLVESLVGLYIFDTPSHLKSPFFGIEEWIARRFFEAIFNLSVKNKILRILGVSGLNFGLRFYLSVSPKTLRC